MHEPSSLSPSRFGWKARLRSFVFAWRGICWLVRDEPNARLHLAVSLCVVVTGIGLQVSARDWRWLLLAMALVWSAEAFNTAVEELCDRIEPRFDPSIGRVKDIAAGAVLFASMAAGLIGVLTLAPLVLAV